MTKTYFVVCDASPEDNLVGNDDHLHSLAMIVGNTIEGLELVRAYPGGIWKYRKWAGAHASYKSEFIRVAPKIRYHLRLMFAVSCGTEKHIKRQGLQIWCDLMGKPPPGELTKKGKTRHRLEKLVIDGKVEEPFWMSEDQMAVLGFYADSIVGLTRGIDHKINSTNKYHVLWDKLHSDRDKTFPKVTLLKNLIQKMSSEHVIIDGVPTLTDKEPRDLLVDNIAGLVREIRMNSGTSLFNQFEASELKRQLQVNDFA